MKKTFKYKYDDLFNPTLKAIHSLGGSSSVSEIEEEVANILQLTDSEINDIHRGNRTKLMYRLAWARNYLKRYGLLENSSRGVWALTKKGLSTKKVDKEKVKRFTKADSVSISGNEKNENDNIINDDAELASLAWKDRLIVEVQKMKPDAFERLCQRLLRELGFKNVEVTGRTNDGGIDGVGMLKLGGVLSFHVVFQAKRYKGSVSASIVRDFRGAMIGRADKGVIITTGNFTREAKKEATRDGAPPIDIIDGNELAEKLKLGIGVEVELVEKVIIKDKWFESL